MDGAKERVKVNNLSFDDVVIVIGATGAAADQFAI